LNRVRAGRYYQDFVSILEENELPVYNDIRSAVKSLDRFVAYYLNYVGKESSIYNEPRK